MKSKASAASVWVEYHRVPDKKSMFRTSEPDSIYVQIVGKFDKSVVILREFIFQDAKAAKEHYDRLRGLMV